MSLIGRGTNGTVYQLSAFIAVKRARTGEEEQADHANEQKIFQFLKNHPQIPHLIRCFYQRPHDTFLELAPNGSVAMLLSQYQKRDGIRVLKILQALNPQEISRWMRQLCLAAMGLEKVGLTHGDIRPGNMLLDSKWNLKLSDIDRAIDIGEEITVLTEPFGRLLSEGDDGVTGSYGKAGARTETFAIGSVYYTLLRGHEPYETESWGTDHFVILSEKFQDREFPPLANSTGDAIIGKCWNGEYHSMAELSAEFPDGAEQDDTAIEDEEFMGLRQLECKRFIKSGLVDTLERY
jgi:atypical protein kinase C zeta type